MADLSPAARAVLTAVTWKKYDVPPEGLPTFAEEMAPLIAAALRALDSRLGHEVLNVRCVDCSQIELIAAELEGLMPPA